MGSGLDVGYGFATGSWTGAGTVDITDSRLRSNIPKAVYLFTCPAQPDDTMTDGFSWAITLYDGTRVHLSRVRAQDGHASGSNGTLWDDGTSADWEVEDDVGNLVKMGTIEMIANGCRLTSTSGTGDIDYMAIFFYGGDVQAYVNTQDLGPVGSWSIDVTAPGFQPDVVLFVGANAIAKGSDYFAVLTNIGVATPDGQMSQFFSFAGTGTCYCRLGNNTFPAPTNSYPYSGDITVSGFDANGFTLSGTYDPNNYKVGYLALDLGGSSVSFAAASLPLDANDVVLNLGFEAGLMMAIPSNVTSTNATHTTAYGTMQGIGAGVWSLTPATDQMTFTGLIEDGPATTNSAQIRRDGGFVTRWTENHLTEWQSLSIKTWAATSVTLQVDNSQAATGFFGYIAMEVGTPTPADGPNWTKQTGPGTSFAKQTGPACSWNKQTGPGSSWVKE